MMQQKTKTVADTYSELSHVELIEAGAPYFNRLIRLIQGAMDSIHIQTYIYDDDVTGHLIAEALTDAIKRKVHVYVMADGYASRALSQSFIDKMRKTGIHFRVFESIFNSKNFYFGRRLHHKVAVFDARYALVGGINISDHYNDLPGKPAWLDFALYVEGEIAKQLCGLCWMIWNGDTRNRDFKNYEAKPLTTPVAVETPGSVRMRRNDWVMHKNEISATYIEMLRHAQSHITILCSYFLPGKVIRRQMLHAIQRGVSIRVIAAGRSDVALSKYAERWLYDWLLRNGIELYEYQKNILHGKIAVCDDKWMTIGSYNINNISTYASIELNLDVHNPSFAKEVRETLENIISSDCIQITSVHLIQNKNIFKQFARWLSYQLIRITFYLFTFYFRHLN